VGSTCAGGLTRCASSVAALLNCVSAPCALRARVRRVRWCSACCLAPHLSLCAPRPCCPAPRRLALLSAWRAAAAPCRSRRPLHPLPWPPPPPFQRGGLRWARRRTSCAWTSRSPRASPSGEPYRAGGAHPQQRRHAPHALKRPPL
jgi:hypothetical protein